MMAKLTIKQQKFADEYLISGNATQAALMTDEVRHIRSMQDPIKQQIKAAECLLKRCLCKKFNLKICVDGLAVIISINATSYQKMAARVLLNYYLGVHQTNNLIEQSAVITDREDMLVKRWRKRVLERDKYTCQHCGSHLNLCAHHISYWSNDPVNRINVDNGITLCSSCHAEEHRGERVYNLMAKKC